MRNSSSFINLTHLASVICAMVLIILFIYSATSKLMTFDKFTQEMSLSPFFIGKYVSYLAMMVLVLEFMISALLLFPKTRNSAFLLSLVLLNIFTIYIYMLLQSDFIPCSCGGILNKIDWGTHMIFNGIFMIIAVLGYLYNYDKKK